MNKKVVIVDYFAGNIASVKKAFEFLGCDVELREEPAGLAEVDRLVLPGVGAFGDGMARLKRAGLADAILEFADRGRPLLGICLGMQMLLSDSEEFGQHEGLDLIPGQVLRLPESSTLRIPNIGWQPVQPGVGAAAEWQGTILDSYASVRDFYFVHSYAAQVENPDHALGVSDFDGHSFASVVRKGNVMGTQFHPEKSKAAGLLLLTNFINL